jgi:hypothetical protein
MKKILFFAKTSGLHASFACGARVIENDFVCFRKSFRINYESGRPADVLPGLAVPY